MISEHVLNTTGYITTNDLVILLIESHKENIVPVVMLNTTAHQAYHGGQDYIPPNMTFGKWWELLYKFK
jgi:hypothetical protein